MARNDGEFEDDRDMGEEDSKPRRRRAEPSGGTNWGKILLILFGIGLLSIVLCCGGGFYMFKDAGTDDPAKIALIQKEIVEIDIPADLQPAVGVNVNLFFMKMKMAVYNPQSATSLMLMQMQLAGQSKEQMQASFKQQAGQQQQNRDFRMESSETKTVKIDGQDVDFLIAKGTLNSQGAAAVPVRMVTGMFPSKDGMGFIQYSIDEEKYDKAAVIKTLESIHK